MDEEKEINRILKAFRGRQLPVLRWSNHPDMLYRYDHVKKCLIVDEIGICVDFNFHPSEISHTDIYDALSKLEDKVYEYFHEKCGFDLVFLEY